MESRIILVSVLFLGLLFKYTFQYSVVLKNSNKKVVKKNGWLSYLLWTAIYLLIIFLSTYKILFENEVNSSLILIGLFIWICGIALRTIAIKDLNANYHELNAEYGEHSLVTKGIYSKFRHPLHLGLLIEILGGAIIYHSINGYIALIIAVIVALFRNYNEEQTLLKRFGKEYIQYKNDSWDLVDILK